jgi:hypothetical protein
MDNTAFVPDKVQRIPLVSHASIFTIFLFPVIYMFVGQTNVKSFCAI